MGAIDVSDRNRSRWLCRDAAGRGQQGRRQGLHRDLAGAGMRGCAAHGSAGDLYGCSHRAALARAGLGPVQPGHTASAHTGHRGGSGGSVAVTIALTQPITEPHTAPTTRPNAQPDTEPGSNTDADAFAELSR